MLTRLLGSDVTRMWPLIDRAIETSLDREVLAHSTTKERILRKILEGRIVCWLAQYDGEVSGIMMTSILEDDIIACRSLLIFLLSSLGKKAKAADFVDGMEKLMAYAQSINCRRFVFYTKNPKMLKLLKYLSPGISTDYTMAVIDL